MFGVIAPSVPSVLWLATVSAVITAIVAGSVTMVVVASGVAMLTSFVLPLLSSLYSLFILSFSIVLDHGIKINFFVAHSLLIIQKYIKSIKVAIYTFQINVSL